MKKLILVASLCVAGFVLAPIASANAAVKGTCTVTGTAEFAPNLKFEPEQEITYNLKSGPKGAVCDNETTGNPKEEGEFTVTGAVKATCMGPWTNVKDGEGTLKGFAGEPVGGYKFDLDVTGTANGIVNLLIEKFGSATTGDEVTAEGKAVFFFSAEEPAAKCFTSAGVKKLEFVAVARGSIG
jgi:hypothetical protein